MGETPTVEVTENSSKRGKGEVKDLGDKMKLLFDKEEELGEVTGVIFQQRALSEKMRID